MTKKIWDIFPSYIQRKRVQRGVEAKGKILSLPSEEELFASLSDEMLLLHQTVSSANMDILVVYKRANDNHYGLLITKWCRCRLCLHPIMKCNSGELLQQLVDRYLARIIWFDSFISLYNSLPKYSYIKEFSQVLEKYANNNNLYIGSVVDPAPPTIRE